MVSKFLQLPQIPVEIAAHLAERVAAEFFYHRLREHDRNHRFAGNSAGRDDANVGALVRGRNGMLRHHVDRAEGSSQCGDRLQVSAHDNVFAVRDASLEASGAVRCARELFGGWVVSDFVHDFGAVGGGRRDTRADFHTLHGLN